jgi:hypothetical protein
VWQTANYAFYVSTPMLNIIACPLTQSLNSTQALGSGSSGGGGFMSWFNDPSTLISTAVIFGLASAAFWVMQKQAIPPATAAEVNLEEFPVHTAPEEAEARELVETK